MSTSHNLGLNLQATGSDNGTWGIVLNNNQSVIDSRAGGRVSVDCTGASNITVSGSQAQNFFQTLTGTLTGNIKYILPAQGGQYYIENSTTGAYTITVVNDVSGTGVVIAQNTSQLIASNPDNTTVSGVVPTALSVNTLQVTSLNTAGVVTTDASGNLATNTTLPAARFPALTGDVTTVSGAVATTIENGVVSLAKMADMATASMLGRATAGTGSPEVLSAAAARTNMELGSAALLTAGNAANNAVQLNSSAQLPAVDGSLLTGLFGVSASSIVGNGYIKFTNGLTLQWGSITGTSSIITVTFPVAFSNNFFIGMATYNDAGHVSTTIGINTTSVSSMAVHTPSIGAGSIFWMAIGN